MSLYKIIFDSRNYETWTIVSPSTLENIIIEGFNPTQHKLFNNDVFTYNNETVEIVHSSIRYNENIPAVIILNNNKTYGREIKANKKPSKQLLYKCIPDDVRLPVFLVPYDIKQLGFSKVLTNL